MENRKKLAIVIPAYKCIFFKEALQSIANQTCKDFTLYIGDDASPHDLRSIVEVFNKEICIVYKRFDINMGQTNLVSHWNRCVGLTKSEEWVWLFSDDDILDPACVEVFYDNLSRFPNEDLFRFDVQIIDGDGKDIGKVVNFPERLSSKNFYLKRLKKKLFSFVVEYVVRKSTLIKKGGFQNFDLGWSSDDATWIKLSIKHGIKTISGPVVKWRSSGVNISSILNNKPIVLRKLNSNVEFLLWAEKFFEENEPKYNPTKLTIIKWLLTMLIETSSLTLEEKKLYLLNSLGKLGLSSLRTEAMSLHLFGEFKKKIKNMFH